MPSLSQDIIAEILSRLPVKSLCRFRCVSKSWLHLTTQPHFIQTHLTRTHCQKLILGSRSLFILDHLAPIDDDLLPLELDFPLKAHMEIYRVQICGSCNGLVCIMTVTQSEGFFIFNPSIRQSFKVPDCPLPIHVCPREVTNFYHVNSFGYDRSIDDYKFVKVAYGCMVLVYSLRKNSWKRVQDFPYKHALDGVGTFLNGAVHWLCGPLGFGNPCVIATYDLAEEKFSDLSPPDSVTDCKRFTTGVLGGCLCLLQQQSHSQHSFWVMKEYNVKESWTRVLIMDFYKSLKPLCYWKGTTKILLVRNRKQLLLCNTKDGTCKNFVENGLPCRFSADLYVESLVSPNFQQS